MKGNDLSGASAVNAEPVAERSRRAVPGVSLPESTVGSMYNSYGSEVPNLRKRFPGGLADDSTLAQAVLPLLIVA